MRIMKMRMFAHAQPHGGGLLSFQDLWNTALTQERNKNIIYYHPCCDIWTTKASMTKRLSHKESVSWRTIISSLPKGCLDIKKAFETKMKDLGWAIPATLNGFCKKQPPSEPTATPLLDLPHSWPCTDGLPRSDFIEHKNINDTQTFSLPPRSQGYQEE